MWYKSRKKLRTIASLENEFGRDIHGRVKTNAPIIPRIESGFGGYVDIEFIFDFYHPFGTMFIYVCGETILTTINDEQWFVSQCEGGGLMEMRKLT